MNTIKSIFNKDYLEGSWGELKGKIQQNWSKLSDDDLGQVKGDANTLMGKIQQAYGYTKEEAKLKLEEFGDKIAAHFNNVDSKNEALNANQDGLNTTSDLKLKTDKVADKIHQTTEKLTDKIDGAMKDIGSTKSTKAFLGKAMGETRESRGAF